MKLNIETSLHITTQELEMCIGHPIEWGDKVQFWNVFLACSKRYFDNNLSNITEFVDHISLRNSIIKDIYDVTMNELNTNYKF